MPAKSLEQVVGEFLESRSTSGVTETYVRGSRYYLRRFTGQMSGNIADLTVADINAFLRRQENLGPVSRNSLRRCLVVMFGFAMPVASPLRAKSRPNAVKPPNAISLYPKPLLPMSP
jgi:hypothetical protein